MLKRPEPFTKKEGNTVTLATLTDFARRPPPPPPTNTVLAGGDEFDPRSSQGLLFFCWCVADLGGWLAPDTERLLREIERYARDDSAVAQLKSAMDAARFDAIEDVGGSVYSRNEFQATLLSVGAARIAFRFAEAMFGRELSRAPTLFNQLAELIFIRRTGQPIISSSKVEVIKAELRLTWSVWG
jgi:hypothetical protein